MRPDSRRARAFESRLVWIFGSPRSGSTWLLNLLTHPLVPVEDSTSGVGRLDAPDADAPPALPINEPYAQHHIAPALSAEILAAGRLPMATLPGLRRGAPNYFLSDRFAEAWRPHLRLLVLARLAAQADAIAREYSLPLLPVVIKEPNGSIGADFVMELLPRARMVFLLRDGRDVVDSMLDAQMPGGWLADPGLSDLDHLRERRLEIVMRESRLWLARTQATLRAYEAHAPELRRIVRYEEARTDPGPILADLEAWLRLRRTERGRADALRWNDFDLVPAEAKGAGKPMRAARPGLWRENLGPDEQAAMHDIMGAQLSELGYELYETS
jgi:hypothetical protein